MSLQIVTLLALLACASFVVKRMRAGIAYASLAFAIVWLIGSGLLTAPMLGRLQGPAERAEPTWASNNVIVLLGWDIVKWPSGEVTVGVRGAARVQATARLYRLCRKSASPCTIIASSGDPTHLGRSEAAAMADALDDLGVPRADVRLEDRSDNTFQNAEYSSALIEAGGYDRITLVTSGFHLARARLYFAHFLARPIATSPADHIAVTFSWFPTAINLWSFDLAATELVGIARYHLYTRLGWNPPARFEDRSAAE